MNGFEILRGIDLDIPRGVVSLVTGPNGAGKSTLVKCIVGVARCSGEIIVEGIDVVRRGVEARKIIGYSPQIPVFPRGLRTREVVELHARLHSAEIDVDELLKFFGLLGDAHKRVEELSGGKRQRLSIALAFAHDPRVVLLDEPFNNLDQEGREVLIELLRSVKGGKTVIMVTHPVEGILDIADMEIRIEGGEVRWVR